MRPPGLRIEEIRAAAAAVRERTEHAPRVGLVLGTGLVGLADEISEPDSLAYEEIPGFPPPSVEGHEGTLVLGGLEGTPVAAMLGRYHRYEGHSLQVVTFPIRVLRELGCELLVVSNICGAMHPLWGLGDLVLIADHINLMGDSPLIGPNLDEQGPRFPDMSRPYDPDLRALARREALERGILLRDGVYVAVTGPNVETAAEYRMLRALGADVVGMSTVPEVIVACHAGMRVLGLGIVTDLCHPDALEPVDVEEIMATASSAEPDLTGIVRGVLARLAE